MYHFEKAWKDLSPIETTIKVAYHTPVSSYKGLVGFPYHEVPKPSGILHLVKNYVLGLYALLNMDIT